MWPFKGKNKTDSKPEVETTQSIEDKITHELQSVIKDSKIIDNCLFLKSASLWIRVVNAQDHPHMIQSNFTISNKVFDSDIIESMTGIGDDIDVRVAKLVQNFILSAFIPIMDGLTDKNGEQVSAPFDNTHKNFKFYSSNITCLGNNQEGYQPINYWDLIGGEILKRLGNKKTYYVKIYSSKNSSSVICECRINNIVNDYITSILNENADKWDVEQFYSEKQCILLIQDESTHRPYKFTDREVISLTEKALSRLGTIESYENYYDQLDWLVELTSDSDLAVEIFSFTPEIICELVCNDVTFRDSLIILREGEQTEVYNNQISSYPMIYQGILKMLSEDTLTQDMIKNLLFKSSSFNVINQMLNDGSESEHLMMTSLAYNVPENYRVK